MVRAGHIREAVGVFDSSEELEAAIDEILSSGFDRAEISLLAGSDTVEEKLGHLYRRTGELEDDPDTPTIAYIPRESIGEAEGALIGALTYLGAVTAVGTIVASGGTLAAAIGAAALAGGTGGLIGTILAQFVDKHHADYLQEQLDHGGILLWVRTRDAEHEKLATEILSRHSGRDVHVHGIAA